MESLLQASDILLFGIVVEDVVIPDSAKRKNRLPKRKGDNNLLGMQFFSQNSKFARIYAFSYGGAFYELPWPALFLVHSKGKLVTPGNNPPKQAARAPTDPSKTGVSAANFQFADDVRYWSYDKADYTVRLDVETGMFEQVLLDAMFDGGGPGGVAGVNVRGVNARGVNVRGVNVRGVNVRGVNVRGSGGGGD